MLLCVSGSLPAALIDALMAKVPALAVSFVTTEMVAAPFTMTFGISQLTSFPAMLQLPDDGVAVATLRPLAN